jgi:hypothetical protein
MPSYAKDLSGAPIQSLDTRGNPYITTSKNMCIANLHTGICLLSMFITPDKKHYDLYVFDPHCILVRIFLIQNYLERKFCITQRIVSRINLNKALTPSLTPVITKKNKPH